MPEYTDTNIQMYWLHFIRIAYVRRFDFTCNVALVLAAKN